MNNLDKEAVKIREAIERAIEAALEMGWAVAAASAIYTEAEFYKFLDDLHLTRDEARELITLAAHRAKLSNEDRDRLLAIGINQTRRYLTGPS